MLHRLRQLLLLIALFGLLVGVIWVLSPGSVRRLDLQFHKNYEARCWEDIARAEQFFAGGEPERSLEVLEDLVDFIGEVQVGDNRDDHWRKAMELRVKLLASLGRFDEAAVLGRRYHEYAPRDVGFSLLLGQILAKSEPDSDEGLELFGKVQHILPEWSRAAHHYGAELVSKGREHEAVEVGLEFLRPGRNLQTLEWTVFLDEGDGFSAQKSFRTDLAQGETLGRYHLSFNMPKVGGTLRALRFDPPLWACCRLSDWELVIRTRERVLRIGDPAKLSERSRWRRGPHDSLETVWVDHAFLIFEFEEPIELDGTTRIELGADIGITLPPGVRQLLDDHTKLVPIMEWLREEGRIEDVDLLLGTTGV